MPPTALIHALKVSVPEQPHLPRKAESRTVAGPTRISFTATAAHGKSSRMLNLLNPYCGDGITLLAETGLHRNPLASFGAAA